MKRTYKKCPFCGIECEYLDKAESAWEMFRRLLKKYKEKFINKLANRNNAKYMLNEPDNYSAALKYLIRRPAQKAIKIMQEIEKELKECGSC